MASFALEPLPALSAISITNHNSGRTLVLSNSDARDLANAILQCLGMTAYTRVNALIRRKG